MLTCVRAPSFSTKISNVGFLDVSTHTVGKAVASDTLFIHGSLTGGGASMFEIRAALDTSRAHEFVGESKPADQCTSACGPSTQMLVPEGTLTQMLAPEGTSTVCDRSCFPGENGPRFSGLNCGAGDPEKLGGNCRLCYKDPVEAGKREAELSQRNVVRDVNMPQEHVIMCDTLLPPQTSACSSKCLKKVDTVSVTSRLVGGLSREGWKVFAPSFRLRSLTICIVCCCLEKLCTRLPLSQAR